MASWCSVSADTHYEVLGVEADATQDDIKAAYRRLSRQVHPDQGGSGALFRRVTEAYETLSDPERRKAYDDALRMPRGRPEPEEPVEEAPGWVRVDDVPPEGDGAGRTDDGAAGGTAPDGAVPPPRRTPDPDADGSFPGGEADTRSGIGRFFALHPAGCLAGVGMVLIVLPGFLRVHGAPSLGILGFLMVIVGTVALIGGRRVIRSGQALGLVAAEIDTMTGPQFESLLEALFSGLGCRVYRTGHKGGIGPELVIEQEGRRSVVMATRSAVPVGRGAVQQAIGAKAPHGATGAMVVTNATFTAHATTLAREHGVVLWDRRVLFAEMRRHSLAPTQGQGYPAGLSGGALLGAELRAGFSMLAKATAVVVGVMVVAKAASGTRPSPRRRR